MIRHVTPDDLRTILRNGDFNKLIGAVESDWLECKKAPYDLAKDSQKRELAKDISGLANVSGGIILVGVETYKSLEHSGDEIKAIHAFPQNQVDPGRYSDVLLRWVYPPLKDIEFRWYKSCHDPKEGIGVIDISEQPPGKKPFLIARLIEEVRDGKGKDKVVETIFGYAERRRDRTVPMSIQEIQGYLKEGFQASAIIERLETLQETLQKKDFRRTSRISTKPAPIELLDRRIEQAFDELELPKGQPGFILVAAPTHSVTIQDIYASRESKVVHLLQNPPSLRPSGFDLDTGGRAARIVEAGERRRSLEPKYKALNLWKDGTLIFAADALDFVCWRPVQKPGTPLRIHQLALIECTYLFVELSRRVFEEASPTPGEILYKLQLSNLTMDGVRCGLIPGPVGNQDWKFGRNIHREAYGKVIAEIAWNGAIDPGKVAYEIVSSVYEQFGMEHEYIPYKEKEGKYFRISPAEIKTLHAK